MFSTILHIKKKKRKRKNDVYRHYIEKNTHSKSLCMSIANHIYVFNNPAYTGKTTPLIFKNKNEKTVFIDIIYKKNSESLSIRFES